jgi:hypothetical protein
MLEINQLKVPKIGVSRLNLMPLKGTSKNAKPK